MLKMENVPRGSRYKLFGEVVKTAPKLDSLIIVEINGVKKTRVEQYANILPRWVNNYPAIRSMGQKRGKNSKLPRVYLAFSTSPWRPPAPIAAS